MAPYCRPQTRSDLRVRRSPLTAQRPPTYGIQMMSSVANQRRENRTAFISLGRAFRLTSPQRAADSYVWTIRRRGLTRVPRVFIHSYYSGHQRPCGCT
ncbi:hypothetical protein Q8A67_012641 [Cirrhinus molitorella]|uniref:Uncharacterized protein n=1 Tax=Cirrhinus molitorella TaxID=172907 RepID=A0AA88TP94_9TELE|nr:hypothetical protein Q8A67_012641 [Cirrhinus molitorella]